MNLISFEAAVKVAPDIVVVAIPSLDEKQKSKIIQRARKITSNVYFLPTVEEILDGRVSITDLKYDRPILDTLINMDIEFSETILELFTGSTVLVTGGGGSIGS